MLNPVELCKNIVPLLDGAMNPDITIAAILAIGDLKGKMYTKNIVSSLKRANKQVQIAVFRALVKLKAKEYVKTIYPYVFNSDEEVRREAIETIKKLS